MPKGVPSNEHAALIDDLVAVAPLGSVMHRTKFQQAVRPLLDSHGDEGMPCDVIPDAWCADADGNLCAFEVVVTNRLSVNKLGRYGRLYDDAGCRVRLFEVSRTGVAEIDLSAVYFSVTLQGKMPSASAWQPSGITF